LEKKNHISGLRSAYGLSAAFGVLLSVSCRVDMHVQPKYRPLDPSPFFDDQRSERPVIPGTVARGQLRIDEHLYTGKVNGDLADSFPFPIGRQDLERGRQRYDIYCTPCHGYLGDGRGMIVQRGFPAPPSYHIDRLRKAPVGHFFDVITNGYGTMHSYAARVQPEDRWRIAAYIRALQLSQDATLNDVPEEDRTKLTQGTGQ
jgi:mono/diheme cytochrome c family protein